MDDDHDDRGDDAESDSLLGKGRSDGPDKYDNDDVDESGCCQSGQRRACWKDKGFYMIISLVAVVQGGGYLSRLAVNYFFKDDLHLSPAGLAVASGAIMSPWVIKPVYGFISDSFPIFGRRRQPYFFIFGFLGFVMWEVMATMVHTILSAVFVLWVSSLSLAFVNVLAEALIVEKGGSDKKDPDGTKNRISFLMTVYWGFESLSKIVSGFTSGMLLERVSKQTIFAATGFFPLTLCFVALFLNEKPSGKQVTLKEQWGDLNRHLSRPYIYKPALFMFVWMATPSSQSAYFYFLTNEIKLEPSFMGVLHVVEGVSSIAGLLFYHSFLKQVHYRKLLFWTIILGFFASMTPLILITHINRRFGMSDKYFAITDSALLAGIGQVSILPLLVLGAQTCPRNVEGTLYALLMSTLNVGAVVSDNLGGAVTWALGVSAHNFKNLWLLVVVCNVLSLFPLPLLYTWVPTDEELAEQIAKADDEDVEEAKRRAREQVLVDEDYNSSDVPDSDSDAGVARDGIRQRGGGPGAGGGSGSRAQEEDWSKWTPA